MTDDQDQQALHAAADVVVRLIAEGKHDEAVDRMVNTRAAPGVSRELLIRTIISTGQHYQHVATTRAALDAFERVKKSDKPSESYYYDVANGYQVLYDQGRGPRGEHAFEFGPEVNTAIRYFERAATTPEAWTNLGNLLDSVGRPLEAISAYRAALDLDRDFGMAWGNWGITVEHLASSGQYSGGLLLEAHRLLQEAIDRPASVEAVGGLDALLDFVDVSDSIEAHFDEYGQGGVVHDHHRHDPRDDSADSDFVKYFTTMCLERDLYLNLHVMDQKAEASVGDSYFPTIVMAVGGQDDYRDLILRINEIRESFATARYLVARSQYVDDDTRQVSEQTTLVNTLDYAVSNLYVGLLKAAYKEAFSTLDKLAVLVNHYLGIGHAESGVYYGTVWFAPDAVDGERRIAEPVGAAGYQLFGTYLLCLELRGSRYSSLRNAMTHRYARVYRYGPVEKGGYDFDRLVDLTAEVLLKVKCAVIYVTQYIAKTEQSKAAGDRALPLPAWTGQNLDLWE